jgi:hypothetical protein
VLVVLGGGPTAAAAPSRGSSHDRPRHDEPRHHRPRGHRHLRPPRRGPRPRVRRRRRPVPRDRPDHHRDGRARLRAGRDDGRPRPPRARREPGRRRAGPRARAGRRRGGDRRGGRRVGAGCRAVRALVGLHDRPRRGARGAARHGSRAVGGAARRRRGRDEGVDRRVRPPARRRGLRGRDRAVHEGHAARVARRHAPLPRLRAARARLTQPARRRRVPRLGHEGARGRDARDRGRARARDLRDVHVPRDARLRAEGRRGGPARRGPRGRRRLPLVGAGGDAEALVRFVREADQR